MRCHCCLHPPLSRDEGYYILAVGFKRWRGGPSTGGPARYGQVGFSTYVIDWPWSSMVWSTFITEFSRQRNHLWVWCMDLGQQLQLLHPTDIMPSLSPFLLVMRLQVHKLLLVSVWVFSFTNYIFKYQFNVIEQTTHNLGVSTSVSAFEISDHLHVSCATGINLVHHIKIS